MNCPRCKSENVVKNGKEVGDMQLYTCHDCKKAVNSPDPLDYEKYCFWYFIKDETYGIPMNVLQVVDLNGKFIEYV